MARISRRDWLRGVAAFGTAVALTPRIGRAEDLKQIRFGTGLKSISPIVINTLIGEGLGYNKEEGFQLKPLPLGNNSNVQIAVERGEAEFGIGTPSFQLPLLAKGQLGPTVDFYEYTYPYKWDVVVKPDSPIHSYAELKGKKIGVSDLGATDYPVTRRVLKSLGIDPDKDVTWVAVGQGVPAGVALERGAIDALAYYDVGFGQIEAAGMKLRFLPRPADIPLIGGQYIMCRRDFLASNRALAVGLGRSVAKASVFLLANPAAGAKMFLDMYPQAAPRGKSAKQAIEAVLFSISRRIKLYIPPYPNTKMGFIHGSELQREAEFDGLKIPNLNTLYTDDLIDDINRFDAEKIRAEAKAYKI